VAGALAAAFGLSSGMFTLIYAIFFSPTDDAAGYILFTAIVVGFVAIIAVLVMRPVRFVIHLLFIFHFFCLLLSYLLFNKQINKIIK
jgi:hypothetical protein